MGSYQQCIYDGRAVLPEGITRIEVKAFQFCSSLTSKEIPNSVTEIGYSAYAQYTGLNSIEIPNSVTMIDGFVFDGCKGLKELRMRVKDPSVAETLITRCSLENLSDISILVPIGTESAYWHNEFFAQSKEVVAAL